MRKHKKELRSNFDMLNDCASWIDPQYNSARVAFTKAMQGRAYGYEALHDAWNWFLTGWNSVA